MKRSLILMWLVFTVALYFHPNAAFAQDSKPTDKVANQNARDDYPDATLAQALLAQAVTQSPNPESSPSAIHLRPQVLTCFGGNVPCCCGSNCKCCSSGSCAIAQCSGGSGGFTGPPVCN